MPALKIRTKLTSNFDFRAGWIGAPPDHASGEALEAARRCCKAYHQDVWTLLKPERYRRAALHVRPFCPRTHSVLFDSLGPATPSARQVTKPVRELISQTTLLTMPLLTMLPRCR